MPGTTKRQSDMTTKTTRCLILFRHFELSRKPLFSNIATHASASSIPISSPHALPIIILLLSGHFADPEATIVHVTAKAKVIFFSPSSGTMIHAYSRVRGVVKG